MDVLAIAKWCPLKHMIQRSVYTSTCTAMKARGKSKCHMDTSVEKLHGLVAQCWARGNDNSVADLSLDPVLIQWEKPALRGFETTLCKMRLSPRTFTRVQWNRPFFSTSVSQNACEETAPTSKQLLTSARSLGQQDELALDRGTVHSQNDSPNREGHRLPSETI